MIESILLAIAMQLGVLVLMRLWVMPFLLGHLDMLVEALRRDMKS